MTQNFSTVHELLESGVAFDFRTHDLMTRLTPTEDGQWSVTEGGERIGRIERKKVDRATYYVGYVEDEPDRVNWVSDEIEVLVGRMLTLR